MHENDECYAVAAHRVLKINAATTGQKRIALFVEV